MQEIQNSAKVKLRCMLVLQNCFDVSLFSLSLICPGSQKEQKTPVCLFFSLEDSKQKYTWVQQFSLDVPDLNLFLLLNQHCTLDRVYLCDQLS